MSLFNKYLVTFFTFHYVSIKTQYRRHNQSDYDYFTFHYVSIKTRWLKLTIDEIFALHSTMSLLKPEFHSDGKKYHFHFTFHYVSIKTIKSEFADLAVMYFTFHYVSIKTLLRLNSALK